MAASIVDHSALKVNQAGIILTVLVAFVGSACQQCGQVHVPPRRVFNLPATAAS